MLVVCPLQETYIFTDTKIKVQRPPNERDQFKLQRLSAECWAAVWALMDRCGIEVFIIITIVHYARLRVLSIHRSFLISAIEFESIIRII